MGKLQDLMFFGRQWVKITVILLGALFLASCSHPPKIYKLSGYAQGTTYHISWWSNSAVPKDTIRQQFITRLASIDKELSTWRNDSYISKFNDSSSTQWQKASTDFIQLVQIAKRVNQRTSGCYDPTVGPLFDLWGFHKNKLHVPTAAEIASVQQEVGLAHIHIDPKRQMVRKDQPNVQLDLSSMGEGYTIKKLIQILQSHHINNYLVEFGGDMKVKGHKPSGKKWRVAIERPIPTQDGLVPYRIVTINDEQGVSLNTSGTYHHSFDENGKEYSHILDPRTGQPVTHDLVSASVFGQDPRVSDAWATAMLCLGPQQGAKIAKQYHLSVFFIRRSHHQLIPSKSHSLVHSKRVSLAPVPKQ